MEDSTPNPSRRNTVTVSAHAFALTASLFVLAIPAMAKPDHTEVYRTVGDVELKAHFFFPKDHGARETPLPCLVFFNGGGWISGDAGQFFPQSRHLANWGVVSVCMEYRVRDKHGTTPVDAFVDAAHAVAWVRANAERFNLAPQRIGAGGGSAGGQLAAATATVPEEHLPDDLPASCRPDLLLLFNPVLDNGPDGYGHERIGDDYLWLSPLHNVHDDMPPTLIMTGTKDHLIPVATMELFKTKMAEQCNPTCHVNLYEGQGHGFFNKNRGPNGRYRETLQDTMKFLVVRKWIDVLDEQP